MLTVANIAFDFIEVYLYFIVRSKAAVLLLLLIRCLLLLPLWGFCVCSMFSYAVHSVLPSQVCIHLDGEERAGCFALLC